MLVVETIARIRRDHLVKGVPIKMLARDLRVSRNTIRKVVRGDATSHTYERTIQPMPKLGPWVEELERQLEANERKQRRYRLSLLRIYEDLAALGYAGGYDAVRRYARAWRPAALRRALRNLLENAAGYGGRAAVRIERDDAELRVVVEDEGPGIPEADLERVFEPFVRLEASRSRDTGGSGLGLAIARSIVRGHGGDIVLANRAEGGLRATVALPSAGGA